MILALCVIDAGLLVSRVFWKHFVALGVSEFEIVV